MVYPTFRPSVAGVQYALPLFGKKSLLPPLGLLTVAALTPPEYEIRLIDMNCRPLTEEDLRWADAVLFSAMVTQREALFAAAAAQARALGKFVVFGGPFPTSCADDCRPHCDALVLNEGEITWPLFLADWEKGRPAPLYRTEDKADVRRSPPPRFDLVRLSDYGAGNVQFSRGCPFQCEFCDITTLLGRVPRLKTADQFLAELDRLHAAGHRGQVWVVDDNFIGNFRDLQALLPRLKEWNVAHGHPFHYFFEASSNLADHPEMLRALVEARFNLVFVGLESPAMESLTETRKFQNLRGSLVDKVRVLQRAGLAVMGGFVVGFDNDPPDIFERQQRFIEATAVADAYISVLVALPGTPLFDRLRREGRLLPGEETRHTTHSAHSNIRFKMAPGPFLRGYRDLVAQAFTPRAYFDRALRTLQRMSESRRLGERFESLRADFRSITRAAASGPRPKTSFLAPVTALWRFFAALPPSFRWQSIVFALRVACSVPDRWPWIFHFIAMGYHYHRFTYENMLPGLDEAIAEADRRPNPLAAAV